MLKEYYLILLYSQMMMSLTDTMKLQKLAKMKKKDLGDISQIKIKKILLELLVDLSKRKLNHSQDLQI